MTIDDPRVIDFESFAGQRGFSRMAYSEPAEHANGNVLPNSAQRFRRQRRLEEIHRVANKREELREEYAQKIVDGEIREPTRIETLVRNARGHDDNESVQAARRLLLKRKIDYLTYEIRL